MVPPDTEDKTSTNPSMPTKQRPRLNCFSRSFIKAISDVKKEKCTLRSDPPPLDSYVEDNKSGDLSSTSINSPKEELNACSKINITRTVSSPSSNYGNNIHREKPYKNSKPCYSRSNSENYPDKECSIRNNNKKLQSHNNHFNKSDVVDAQNYKDSENYRGFNSKSHQQNNSSTEYCTKSCSTGLKNENSQWQNHIKIGHFGYGDQHQLSDTQQGKELKNFCVSDMRNNQQDVFSKESNNRPKEIHQKRHFSDGNSHFNNSDYSQALDSQVGKNSEFFCEYGTKNNKKDDFYKEDRARSMSSFQKRQTSRGVWHFCAGDSSQLSDTQQGKESKNFCDFDMRNNQQDVSTNECNSRPKEIYQKRNFSEGNSHFNKSDYSQALDSQESKKSESFCEYDAKNNKKDDFYKKDRAGSMSSFQKMQTSRGAKHFSGSDHSQASDTQQFKEPNTISKYGMKNNQQHVFTRETSTKPKNNYQEMQTCRENSYCNDLNDTKIILDTEQDEESVNCIEFTKACHLRNVSETEGTSGGFTISFQNTELLESPVSTLNPSSDIQSSDISQKIVDIRSDPVLLEFFQHSEGDFIPPPQPPSRTSIEFDISTLVSTVSSSGISETNDMSWESYSETSCKNEASDSACLEPDSEHLKAVTDFILGIVKEKSVCTTLSDKVVRDLNILFKNHFGGNVIDVYGSYYSNLAISTSDINFVMKVDQDIFVRRSFMHQVYKVLSKELNKYHVLPFEEADSASHTRINFSEPYSGILCQLAYLGRQEKHVMNMSKFLRDVCNYGSQIRILLLATKIWAEFLMINEVEEGKLHPVGFAILMIHFLQKHEKLPIYSENHVLESPPPNDSSVGELWIAFLKYYSTTFNWRQDVVTINTKECVSKKSKDWRTFWIAIEDPFSGKNIAKSVINSDSAEHIIACFKATYEYFCSPPESSISFESSDENSNEDSCKWQYSFQHCIVDTSNAFCEMCDELDEICDECQAKIYTPPLPSLPKMTDNFLKLINKSLFSVYEKYVLTDDEIEERRQFVQNLEKNVCIVYPGARLDLFGSSTNGFGFKNSDLDICMTFGNEKLKNTTAVLKHLRNLLRNKKGFTSVIGIFQAQIPIIKFRFQPKGWRGDISVNNTLAVHNSKLLYTYSLIDERCKMLGCALKLLAKKALIAEVTDKALSSYSYLLMVIHFLQQRDPPILPVLQDPQLRRKDYKPDIVEGFDVWFCEDRNYVREVNQTIYEYENNTSVEQLWLDLLDYYCSFDSKQFVTVRQKEPLFRSEKEYSSRLINIQDPFIDTKNLGHVVSHKKAQETENVFRRARRLFRTPITELPTSVKDLEDYFFSTMSLTGRIHKEAHCDSCGKFGHETKDCKQTHFPIRRNNFRRYPIRYPNKKVNIMHRKPMNGQSKRY